MDLKALIASSKQGATLREQVQQTASATSGPSKATSGSLQQAVEAAAMANGSDVVLPATAKSNGSGLVLGKPGSKDKGSVQATGIGGNNFLQNLAERTIGNKTDTVITNPAASHAVSLPGSAVAGSPAQVEQPNPAMSTEAELAREFHYEHQGAEFSQQDADEFRASLEILKNNLDNPSVVGSAIRHVMTTLQEHPGFATILLPEDVGMMVRGLRQSYQTAVVIKQTKAKKTVVKNESVDAALDMMAGMKFG